MLKCYTLKVIIVGYTFLSSINPVSAMNFIFKVTFDMAICVAALQNSLLVGRNESGIIHD